MLSPRAEKRPTKPEMTTARARPEPGSTSDVKLPSGFDTVATKQQAHYHNITESPEDQLTPQTMLDKLFYRQRTQAFGPLLDRQQESIK